jgi:hypothetical protein
MLLNRFDKRIHGKQLLNGASQEKLQEGILPATKTIAFVKKIKIKPNHFVNYLHQLHEQRR